MLRPLGYAPQKCSRFQVPGLPLRGSAPKGFTLRGPELETWNLELGTQYRQVRDQGKDETRHGTYKFEKLVFSVLPLDDAPFCTRLDSNQDLSLIMGL